MGDLLNIRRSALPFSMQFALGAFLALMAFSATRAEANTYCVDVPGPTGCTINQGDFQVALNQAAGNPGPDMVKLGPITVTTATPDPSEPTIGFTYDNTDTAAGGNSVTIVGAGEGQTTIRLGANGFGDSVTLMDLFGYPNSKISDVSFDISNNQGNGAETELFLGTGNSASNISVGGAQGDNVNGVKCEQCTVSDSTINVPNTVMAAPNTGFLGYAGDSTLEDSTISSGTAFRQIDDNGTAIIKNSRLTGLYGVTTDGGNLNVRDSLVKLADLTGARGINVENPNGGPMDTTVNLDGLTILGDGITSNTRGVFARTTFTTPADPGNQDILLNMANTAIYGAAKTLELSAQGNDGNAITANIRYSAYDNGRFSGTGGGSGSGILYYNRGVGTFDLTSDPLFRNAPAGDYTPLPASALVDAGDPVSPGSGVTDINGHIRACNGTPGGQKVRDIGAFEYNDCVAPNTLMQSGPGVNGEATTTTDRTPAFSVASSEVNSTFKCSFDGGAAGACPATFDAPDQGLGDHTLSVTATDEYGNVDPSPATEAYTVVTPPPTCQTDASLCPPPTCETDASLCPAKDTTAPKVTFVGKVPKKTSKKSIKVKFKSNQSGSTFTCKVGKAKAKSCRSPFKLKLQKGRNVLKIVAANKAGIKSKPVTVKVKRKN